MVPHASQPTMRRPVKKPRENFVKKFLIRPFFPFCTPPILSALNILVLYIWTKIIIWGKPYKWEEIAINPTRAFYNVLTDALQTYLWVFAGTVIFKEYMRISDEKPWKTVETRKNPQGSAGETQLMIAMEEGNIVEDGPAARPFPSEEDWRHLGSVVTLVVIAVQWVSIEEATHDRWRKMAPFRGTNATVIIL